MKNIRIIPIYGGADIILQLCLYGITRERLKNN